MSEGSEERREVERQDQGRELGEIRTELREHRNQTNERFTRLEQTLKDSLTMLEKMETQSLVNLGVQQNLEAQKREADRKKQMVGYWLAALVSFVSVIHIAWDYIVKLIKYAVGAH